MQTRFAHRSLHESIKEFYSFSPEHIEDMARQKTEEPIGSFTNAASINRIAYGIF